MEVVPVFNPASPLAKAIAEFFYFILIICGVVLAIVGGIITWSLARYRARPGEGEPPQTTGNTPLEFAWTLIPLVLVGWMCFLAARTMGAADPEAPKQGRAPDLVVVGHQWWWEARYPNSGAVTANEIHIPTGRRLLVELNSADVIHDFWAPRLSRKMDAVPGHPNRFWLQADAPGRYQGFCAEYCGTQHAWMQFLVFAQTPPEFANWEHQQAQAARQPAAGDAQRGARLFEQMTCANCHALQGTRPGLPAGGQAGPDLTHLASRQTLAAGVVQNNAVNLRRWLENPQQIKPGTLMPNLKLTDAQVADLVRYLEGLK
jgi:cytochrome c oxidase subunit II